EDVLRLLQRQAARRVNQLLATVGIQVDTDPRLVLHVVDDPVEQTVEIIDRWSAELDHGDVLGELDGNPHDRRDEYHRLIRVAQRMGDVAQAADVARVCRADANIEEVVKVLEQEDGRIDVTEHGVKSWNRLAGIRRAGLRPLWIGSKLHDSLAARPDM